MKKILKNNEHFTIVKNGQEINLDEAQAQVIQQEITYDELITLRDNSNLVPGQWYRITDYETTTTQENTRVAGHPFDILVRAENSNQLNENAYTVKHEGDTYFSSNNVNLEAWEIKYCLDNDTDRFAWADNDNGKGVIYYMKDEWGNECPYDFKNIQFKRYKITDCPKSSSLKDRYSILISGITDITVDTSIPYWCYTFSMIDFDEGEIKDVSVVQDTYPNDENSNRKQKSNVIKPYYNGDIDIITKTCLPNNVFVTDTILCSISDDYGEFYGFYNNILGNDCRDNTFGNGCHGNIFGNRCYGNTISDFYENNTCGDNFFLNIIGNDCTNNTFEDNCTNNTIDYSFFYNTLGISCYNNTFSHNFNSNILGNKFHHNTIGDNCTNNFFGNSCNYNTLGNNCSRNTFGNGCNNNTIGNSFQDNTIGNGCYEITFGNSFQGNILGNECHENIFGANCQENTFDNGFFDNEVGNNFHYNIFGNSCTTNIFDDDIDHCSFGNNCSGNNFSRGVSNLIFGNRCHNNTIGELAEDITFGNSCFSNTIGDYCYHITFGDGCNHIKFGNSITVKTYYQNIIVENGNQYIYLDTSATPTSTDYLRNIKISQGFNNTNTWETITHATLNDTFQTIYPIQQNSDIQINVTYEELVTLRDNFNLVPGQWYRITDYETTTVQENTKSARWLFGIIVKADSINTLNENAYAFRLPKVNYKPGESPYSRKVKERKNHFYENDSNLTSWEIKYCLDNDTDRFAWATEDNIQSILVNRHWYYRYSDGDRELSQYQYAWINVNDFFNDLVYTEFSEIEETWLLNDKEAQDINNNLYTIDDFNLRGKGVIYYMKDEYGNECPYDFKSIQFFRDDNVVNIEGSGIADYRFTFSWLDQDNNLLDASVACKKYGYEGGRGPIVSGNIIKPYRYGDLDNSYKLRLNNICFMSNYGYNENNEFSIFSNVFGDDCCENTFGNQTYRNTFGNSCVTFLILNECIDNNFGTYVSNITMNSKCRNNIIESGCILIKFYGDNYQNIIKTGCKSITFKKQYIENVVVGEGNKNIILDSNQITTNNNRLRNIEIHRGVNNSNITKTIYHNTLNDTISTVYIPNGSVWTNVE